ncbi:MAG: FAD-binding oxidoreductase, partial [Solirubrobacterales bacterium]
MASIESLKWWGWGAADHRASLPGTAEAALRDELGVEPGAGSRPVALEAVRLPEPRPVPEPVSRALASGELLTDAEARLRRAAGRSYPDLVRLRAGALERAPDAVAI